MPDINVVRSHNLEPDELRTRMEGVAEEMKKQLRITVSWRGETCVVEGKGIKKCEIKLEPDKVRFC